MLEALTALFGFSVIILFGFYYLLHVSNKNPHSSHLKVGIIHPDLGIGGAEQLIVAAAVAIQSCGHEVDLYTSFHDPTPSRCFPETRDGTLNVYVYGNWLPIHSQGSFQLPKALLSCSVLWINRQKKYDIMIVDQISATIPLLKLSGARVLFYCHFPDMLLTERNSLLKRIYRAPLDLLEELTTSCADKVLVNSGFTQRVFKNTFRFIKTTPEILYPGVSLRDDSNSPKATGTIGHLKVLSLNRFERKKNHELAIRSFARLKELAPFLSIELIVAGGYSPTVPENVEYFNELKELASSLKVADSISFLRSPTTDIRNRLLKEVVCLLYTPPNEHFGIVPLEAGIFGTPTIACNSGGPVETILHGQTGLLVEPSVSEWAIALNQLVSDPALAAELGAAAKIRINQVFSYSAFTRNLEKVLQRMVST